MGMVGAGERGMLGGKGEGGGGDEFTSPRLDE